MSKDFSISIIQDLRQRGFQAYLVGGCVRDLLLNREPADYDVATSATPAQVVEIFPQTYAVGAQFGVVLVPLPEQRLKLDDESSQKSHAIEVATFRSDLGYSDGRRPDEVRFSQDPHAFFGIDRRAIQTEMGETVEIDHQRDLFWAEAVLRDRQMNLRRVA